MGIVSCFGRVYKGIYIYGCVTYVLCLLGAFIIFPVPLGMSNITSNVQRCTCKYATAAFVKS